MKPDFRQWLPQHIFDDGPDEGIEVVLPIVLTEHQEARRRLSVAVQHLERGQVPPDSLGLSQALREIRDGADATEALGLKLPKGRRETPRTFWIALHALLSFKVGTSKLWKDAYAAVAVVWAAGDPLNVKAARDAHQAKAEALIKAWLRWSRDVGGISARSDDEILGAFLRAVEKLSDRYPPP
jgi:hypothetical protein